MSRIHRDGKEMVVLKTIRISNPFLQKSPLFEDLILKQNIEWLDN